MRHFYLLLALGLLLLFWNGCATPAQTAGAVAGGAVGVTIAGGYSPGNEIEQIYYLGVFDPLEQVPPTIYRLIVHGQASAISATKFASGWVPAELIDSLNSHISMDPNVDTPGLTLTKGENLSQIKTGRRLIQFGPEGFREAPKDHRLVVVMGSSPQAFFDAIDQTLGNISSVQVERSNSALREQLFKALLQAKSDEERLTDLQTTIKDTFTK